jgi:hypothetical protein
MTYFCSLSPLTHCNFTNGNSFAGVSGTEYRSQWSRSLRRGSAAAHLQGLRVRILRGHVSLPLEIAVSCQVEIPASDWALVQRSSTESGVSECDREASIMRRPWPPGGSCALVKNSGTELSNDRAWFYLHGKFLCCIRKFRFKRVNKGDKFLYFVCLLCS